jgi:glycine dehydrogenase
MQTIAKEIKEIADGGNRTDNVLKNAPHTQRAIASDTWEHPYTRMQAAFPLPWSDRNKFWPTVSRVDDAFGDRNLVCSCAPIDSYR